MAGKSSIVHPVNKQKFLKVNDLLFVNEYMKNGRNGTQAYRMVHPSVTIGTAEVGGTRMLGKASVQAELARRMQYQGGITREWVESSLLAYKQMADDAKDYTAGATICMDAAKLAGYLIDRREEVSKPLTTLSNEELWAELSRRQTPLPVVATPVREGEISPVAV